MPKIIIMTTDRKQPALPLKNHFFLGKKSKINLSYAIRKRDYTKLALAVPNIVHLKIVTELKFILTLA